MNLVCDLDGVLWHRSTVLDGVPEALQLLHQNNANVLFVTNNSFTSVSELETRITNIGYPSKDRVLTSAVVVSNYLPAVSRIFLVAGSSTHEQLIQRGHILCSWDEAPDFVVVGLRTDFDYLMLNHASQAVRGGAKLIATNDDPAYPTEEGIMPGSGAILSAISVSAGVTPTVVGKPNQPAVDIVSQFFGDKDIDFVIGDRLNHDGKFAELLNSKFIWINSSGVNSENGKNSQTIFISSSNLLDAVKSIVSSQDSNEF